MYRSHLLLLLLFIVTVSSWGLLYKRYRSQPPIAIAQPVSPPIAQPVSPPIAHPVSPPIAPPIARGVVWETNPIDGNPIIWINNEFTRDNYPGLHFQVNQKKGSLKYVLEKGKGVLDIGAHIGDYGIPMAVALKRRGAHVHVYCIDPSKEKCDFMREVARLNGLSEKEITILCAGISDHAGTYSVKRHGTAGLDFSDKNTGAWQYTPDPEGQRFTTLDRLWQSGAIGDIGFFWLDAQWMEPNVLRGGFRYLNHCKPYILIEYTPIKLYHSDGISMMTYVDGTYEEMRSDPEYQDIFERMSLRHIPDSNLLDILFEVTHEKKNLPYP